MFLLSMQSLETVPIRHNPACLHEAAPTFSHDGKQLAYICVHSTEWPDLYSMPVSGGPSKFIHKFNGPFGRVAWTADDTRLIADPPVDTEDHLVEISVNDGSSRTLSFATKASWPAITSNGRLAFEMSSLNTNIWRKDLLHLEAPPVKIAPSTREQNAPQYSPDGKHIAFESTRAGDWALWMSDDDGNNLVQLSGPIPNSGNPHWSPGGSKIAFDSKFQGQGDGIFVVDIGERVPRKLKQMSLKSGIRHGRAMVNGFIFRRSKPWATIFTVVRRAVATQSHSIPTCIPQTLRNPGMEPTCTLPRVRLITCLKRFLWRIPN
jgi:Tol biopolymer transport system component